MATDATRKWFEARKALYAELMAGGPHSPERASKASKLIDDYTHTLADCQREEHDRHRPFAHMGQLCQPAYQCGTAHVINLIDPAYGCGLMCSCVCHAAEGTDCDSWHCVGNPPG